VGFAVDQRLFEFSNALISTMITPASNAVPLTAIRGYTLGLLWNDNVH